MKGQFVRRYNGGFSLLEVLVAFVIMSMALIVLYRVSGGSVRAIIDAEIYDQEVRTALSVLKLHDYVMEGGLEQSGEDNRFAWTMRSTPYPVEGSGPPMYRVVVRVEYRPTTGRSRSFELATLLPQLLPSSSVQR